MNLERQRAKQALDTITELNNKKEELENYVSYVKALPATILQIGLGQALATLLSASKGKSAQKSDHRRLYDQMEVWLCRAEPAAPYPNQKDVMQAITNGDENTYVHAQSEALAYLAWLKKFAVAYLSKPEEGESK